MRAHDNCAREPEEADGGHPPDIRVDIIAAIAGIVSRREDGSVIVKVMRKDPRIGHRHRRPLDDFSKCWRESRA